jgi:transposase
MRQNSRQIDPQALVELRQLARPRRRISRITWRARVVLAFFEGETYRSIARRFGCAQHTIARWIRRFRAEGVAGLQNRPRQSSGTGRRQKLLAVFLPDTVRKSPRTLGLAQDRWTLQSLQAQCVRQTGERPSLESIRRALKRFGYSWKRAKRTVTSPDPDYERKKGQSRSS